MASGGKKKKTTMAKLARETRLRERRASKQAKKDARKQASSAHLDSPEGALNATPAEGAQPATAQAALDPADEESMPEPRPPAHDLTTEKAIKHLFPAEAAEAAKLEAEQERKPAGEAESAGQSAAEQRDVSAKDFALRRLRESPDEELALFEGSLRQDALAAGASEQELREAQSRHPGHS